MDLSTLEGSFTLEELKTAIFDLGGDKAPGQDGFPIHFFKQFWDTIKVDLFQLCEDSFLEMLIWKGLIGQALRSYLR